ncbi:hypothetical protein AALP_AA2G004800 [Arabis alpina]|uniref:NB-ARC domain-containing protein n=1 Tax=Arabis alpina TaxID=50452 RepID=A0A087HEF5_ARAAL|nr:hypothetical protein AALP_AA2G004800 [Arabis alpina]
MLWNTNKSLPNWTYVVDERSQRGPGVELEAASSKISRSTYTRAIYTIRFKSNINDLKNALNGLEEVQIKVNQDLKTLEIKGKSLQIQLMRWLREVEDIVSDANSLQERRVSCALFSKCRLSKKLVVILEKVKKLEKQGVELLDEFSVEGKSPLVEKVLGPSILDQTVASGMVVKVLNCLMSDKVQKIGVWGMGGVGKTTLVRELNNRLWKEAATQRFGMVIWVTVSKEFELGRVQKQIAERLDMQMNLGENEETTARRIYGKLENISSFLLVLDDVWHSIDLDKLGIPQTDGSKIILTSRSLEVCQSIRIDVDFKVDCLREDEAWELFCQNAGEVTRSDRVRPIAKKVAKECGGLPLAIITVGMAMRGKKKDKLWKHALKELKSSVPYVKCIEQKIYQPLKLSYDSLEKGFIDETENNSYLMNQGIVLVENLKDSCLLEEGARDGTVKMHDVVRDFAKWVMSSSQYDSHSLVMSGVGLREFPQEKFVPSLRRVSLMNNKLKKLPESPEGLETLISLRLLDLSRTHHLERIPAGTIRQLSSLEVLDMTLSHFHWSVQGQTQEGQATLEEIASLHRLSILSIRVVCVPHLSLEYNSWIERLKKFQLFIGPTANSLPTRLDKRRVTISSLNVSEAFIGWLLANTISLVMNHCWGLNEMLENLVIDSTSSFNMLS